MQSWAHTVSVIHIAEMPSWQRCSQGSAKLMVLHKLDACEPESLGIVSGTCEVRTEGAVSQG